MPIIENNYPDNILELIGSGSVDYSSNFDATRKDYIRMAVYQDDELISQYDAVGASYELPSKTITFLGLNQFE